MDKRSIGEIGEKSACGYLVKKGYDILRQNYRRKYGEIDIVARAKDRTLVFVEVKTMTEVGAKQMEPIQELVPEDQMTTAKLRKFRRICEAFVARNPDLIDERRGWQMDFVAIDLPIGGEPRIRHYENI